MSSCELSQSQAELKATCLAPPSQQHGYQLVASLLMKKSVRVSVHFHMYRKLIELQSVMESSFVVVFSVKYLFLAILSYQIGTD